MTSLADVIGLVECPKCHAEPKEPCFDIRRPSVKRTIRDLHEERWESYWRELRTANR